MELQFQCKSREAVYWLRAQTLGPDCVGLNLISTSHQLCSLQQVTYPF